MKNIKYLLISCCAFVSACDDFLVENPQTSVMKDGVYNSLSSAEAVLNGCYSTMEAYDGYAFNYFHVLNVTSGMGVSLKSNDVNLTTMNILPSNVNMTNTYTAMYKTIMVANDIIDGMKSSAIEDGVDKNRIQGEAYFIRAVTYFNLVRLFGKVSLITEPVTNYAEAQKPREEVEKVYTQILFDLDKAWSLLPEKADKVDGRPYKYAAKAVRAKVYLTLAGNMTEAETDYWQKCYDDAFDVYHNGGYELVHPYSKLFGSENKNNAESVFEIQFSSAVNSGRLTETTFPVGHDLMSNIPTQGKSWGKTRPLQRAFDQFEAGDPRREAAFVYQSYNNIYESGNKKKVMLYPSVKGDGNGTYKQGDSEYPAWKKYYDTSMTAEASSANFVYMRFADVVLILAEAANELTEHQSETVEYLNEILTRAADANGNGMRDADETVPADVDASMSQEDLREKIFRERLKEFTGECDEWYTIRRRGETYLRKIMQEHNDKINQLYGNSELPKFVYKYSITDDNVKKNMLMPFPQDEITRNENISQEEQNFGY
ncbi:RagB/SusD family nutrient uptake outer membrane protein [Bacteroides sp.]|uniref:RagB/SusD family nutrient uptake outer membrane protein n=1 Tax=Bacteroides sp. TaxID=29523 RepID=UPI00258800BF|nr:RagB/SusD family nutrient uptake outer membrane protein [Bacteroides sp.]